MVARKSFVNTDKTETPKKDNQSGFGKNVLFIGLLLVLIAALYMIVGNNGLSGKIEPISVKNVFLDVDGDGALDFVTYIEYVPNSASSIVFPNGQ